MFNAKSLFSERLKQHITLLNRYLRYIFNGHFMIAILFAIVTLAIFYQQWLESLSPNFRADLLIAFVLSILIVYNPIQTFLKEADKVFLLVQEKEMHVYFKRGRLYNYIMQLYIVIFVIAAIIPLMQVAFPWKTLMDYIILFAFVFACKYAHLYVKWGLLHQPTQMRLIDIFLRYSLTFAFLYFAINEDWIFSSIVFVLFIVYMVNDYVLIRKQAGLHWEVLIANDEKRLAAFYQFVSMFAEVPAVKREQKPRRILTSFIEKKISFQHEQTFRYLFWLTFIRSTEYLNLFIRLTVIGGIAIVFIPHPWFSIGIGLVFLYLTAFQLLPLFHHYRTLVWLDLYPITDKQKKSAYLGIVIRLCFIQTILLACFFFGQGDILYGFLFIGIGIVFNYAFHYLYVQKKLT